MRWTILFRKKLKKKVRKIDIEISKIEKPQKHRKYEKNVSDGTIFNFLIYMIVG